MKMKRPPITADDLRKLGPDALEESLKKLSKTQLEEIRYKWEFWARDNQIEPDGDWYVWFLNCGRSYGKTRTGAEWVRHRVKCGDKRIAGVTATNSDIEKVMIKGESGLLSVCSPNDKTYRGAKIGKPDWSPTKRTLTWANGAIMECFSAEEPERLRGPQFHSFWADELAAWNKDEETWDMLQFTMRLGKKPRGIVTTTPKPTKLVRNLLKRPDFYVTTGSTFENTSLPDSFINQMKQQYEGTRLGAQELYAVVAQESAGALWSQALLDTCLDTDITDPVKFATDNLVRVVVAVDPATSDKVESDMTGIVVAGIDINGNGYILEDATDRYSPQKWAQKAVELYYKYGADRIVAEKNQGGDMVKQTLVNEDNTIPLRMVFASRGKMARAEPVAAMYERGKVKHAPGLGELEQQMVTWEPLGSMGSPDRLDACFVAGTPVLTDNGYTPIEQVTTNHKVLTREGWKNVSWSGKTTTNELTLDIRLSNGYTVTCTPEHPFYVQGQGWTRADELIEGAQLVTEQEVYRCANTLQKLSSTVKLTVDTPTTQTSLNNAITFALAELDSRRSTEMCGNTTTDLSRKGITSITSTGNTSTTPQTTSSVCPQSNTQKNTEKSSTTCVSSRWITQGTLRQFGTVLRKGWSSINGWVKSLGKVGSRTEIALARSVEIPSKPSLTLSTAPTSVPTKCTMTSIGPKWTVPYVEAPFCRTNTELNLRPVPVSVVRVSESKDVSDVYNLHVEECHEFLVSGVLVHNCVWALTDLMLKGRINPEMQILYSKQ